MHIIDTPSALADFCASASANGPVALDMEFERERTYRPILQLVQLASRDEAVLVDPLAIKDLSALWEMVSDPAIEIILHAGMQDMEIAFNESNGKLPANIFDTQIAAALLGMGEQPGYADVVRRITQVALQKGERTTDWSRRPLTEAQAKYALDDVLYLHQVYDELNERLESENRRAWLTEETTFYADRGYFEKDPSKFWLRVSRHRSVRGKNLAVLMELAIWREATAARRDIPRLRVVADDVLIDLARRLPQEIDDLRSLRRLHSREIERGGHEILDAVQRGVECEKDDWPRLPVLRDEDPELNVTADLLATFVKHRAREVSIAPSYLGNKKEISSFAYDHRTSQGVTNNRLGHGWRFDLVGRDLLRFLDGELALSIDKSNGRIRLVPLGQD